MLRTALLKQNYNLTIKLYRTYLTQEFKNVMKKNVTIENINKEQIEAIHVNKRTSAIKTDLLARQLSDREEARADIVDELLKLRNQADATEILGSTSHAVIRHFVEVGATAELVELLKDRVKYGIFVDKFTGSFLMDYLIENKKYLEAMQVAVEHYLQDDYDSQMICALTLKSAYEGLKTNVTNTIEPPKVEEPKEEIKVRVKYLRNIDPDDRSNDLKYMIGKSLLKMSQNTSDNIKINMQIPAYILCCQYADCRALLATKNTFDKDVIRSCIELVEKNKADIPVELIDALQAQLCVAKPVLDALLTDYLRETIKKEETQLIAQQKDNYKLWAQQLNESLQAAIAHREKLMRLENIEQIMEELKTKKKQLWYFDMEDSVDLEIYRKFVFYPKRWFGKKKKPRVIDDGYIPPELR